MNGKKQYDIIPSMVIHINKHTVHARLRNSVSIVSVKIKKEILYVPIDR